MSLKIASAMLSEIARPFLSHTDLLQKSVAKLVTQVGVKVPCVGRSAAVVVVLAAACCKNHLLCVSSRNKRLHQSTKAQESPGEQPSTCLLWPGHINQSDSSNGKFERLTGGVNKASVPYWERWWTRQGLVCLKISLVIFYICIFVNKKKGRTKTNFELIPWTSCVKDLCLQ